MLFDVVRDARGLILRRHVERDLNIKVPFAGLVGTPASQARLLLERGNDPLGLAQRHAKLIRKHFFRYGGISQNQPDRPLLRSVEVRPGRGLYPDIFIGVCRLNI